MRTNIYACWLRSYSGRGLPRPKLLSKPRHGCGRMPAETHLARAQYLYSGLRDYAGALAELEIARPSVTE